MIDWLHLMLPLRERGCSRFLCPKAPPPKARGGARKSRKESHKESRKESHVH